MFAFAFSVPVAPVTCKEISRCHGGTLTQMLFGDVLSPDVALLSLNCYLSDVLSSYAPRTVHTPGFDLGAC